ncbi:acyltransferase [Sphingomonas populi]|uniref:Acyltransferase n=1 Tax=Sphingomonas populi TaxID=2484750 RepID=A0A4V2DC98_9SPHN|nr:acyltransferase [Sphingomonas populi]RZF60738.1 acyltransferase [Sphingomonas populi]
MSSLEAAERPGRTYQGVQILRFIASALVLIAHASIYTQERNDKSISIWHQGGYGVDIFFVISGFVMVMASDPHKRGGVRNAVQFLLKRLARIYPLYWIATAMNLIILIALPKVVLHSRFEVGEVFSWFLLVPTLNSDGRIEPLVGVGWTLYFEMAFYCLFSIFIALRIRPIFLLPILVAGGIYGLMLPAERAPGLVYFSPLLFEFGYGVIIGILARRGMMPVRGGALLIIIGFTTLLLSPARLGGIDIVMHGVSSALVVLGFVVLEPFWSRRLHPTLLVLGAASYAMYLFHPILGPAIPTVLSILHIKAGILSIIGVISVSVAVSLILHKVVEQPLLKKINFLIRSILPDRRNYDGNFDNRK